MLLTQDNRTLINTSKVLDYTISESNFDNEGIPSYRIYANLQTKSIPLGSYKTKYRSMSVWSELKEALMKNMSYEMPRD